ncbi:uncharacterized protein LOC132194905 [Neocloeon triangulifer]|uniref:uncharacterized protein LOC132194905 n=1 Tax=Neocloeon triangulifer TaxID=2078957 RepID=UPI00286F25CB|nr:uncharacterized protein LOC132194905 [Neocloeon triangulifer]
MKSWRSYLRFWTLGTRSDFSSLSPLWCNTRAAVPSWPTEIINLSNKTLNGLFDCIVFRANKSMSNITVQYFPLLALANCSQKYGLACKGPLTPKPSIRERCPLQLLKNASLYENNTGTLKYAGNYGRWVQKCDKFYVFSFVTKNFTQSLSWDAAKASCENIGYKLFTIDTILDPKMTCVKDFFKDNPLSYNRNHWISGMFLDSPEKMKYMWCSNYETVNLNSSYWGVGNPPTAKEDTCLSIVFLPNRDPYVEAIPCKSNLSYICEVSLNGIFMDDAFYRLIESVLDADDDTTGSYDSFKTCQDGVAAQKGCEALAKQKSSFLPAI